MRGSGVMEQEELDAIRYRDGEWAADIKGAPLVVRERRALLAEVDRLRGVQADLESKQCEIDRLRAEVDRLRERVAVAWDEGYVAHR